MAFSEDGTEKFPAPLLASPHSIVLTYPVFFLFFIHFMNGITKMKLLEQKAEPRQFQVPYIGVVFPNFLENESIFNIYHE